MKKRKIITRNKSYFLEKSPLFKIQYLDRLLKVLNSNKQILSSILENKANMYNSFSHFNRDIQTPLNELYRIHNRIASLLARLVQPDYIFSGIKGKSYIENAKEHLNAKEILTTDITAFFPSTTKTMIFWFFKDKLQCSYNIANILADICSIEGHLPTGSQISMPLAYWVNAKMFDELNNLAQDNKLKMTIYVDDVAFSGNKIPKGFKYQVMKVVKKHKHNIKLEKTTLYSQQSIKEVTGLILKDGNILPPNRQFKKLHEYLTNWKTLTAQPRNGKKIEWLYYKIIGLLNNISHFKPKYKNVILAIQKEYIKYKNTPSNYKKEIDTASTSG